MIKVLLYLNGSVPLRPNRSSANLGVVPGVRPGVRCSDHPRSELVGRRCRHGRLRQACNIRCPSAGQCRSACRCPSARQRRPSTSRCRSADHRGHSAHWLCRLSPNYVNYNPFLGILNELKQNM
jgi:hypothetical protein